MGFKLFQVDVKNVFFNGYIKEEVYITILIYIYIYIYNIVLIHISYLTSLLSKTLTLCLDGAFQQCSEIEMFFI